MLVQSRVSPYLGLAILCLAVWVPVGAAAWGDCAEGASGGCCDVDCSVCACCVIGAPATLEVVGTTPVVALADLTEQGMGSHLPPEPRGILHVPRILSAS